MARTPSGHHYLQPLEECKRKFYWQSEQHLIRKGVVSHASAGRLIHAFVHRFRAGMPFDKAWSEAVGAEQVELGDSFDVEGFLQVQRDMHIMASQFAQWEPKEPLMQVHGELEGEFRIPRIRAPYTWRADEVSQDDKAWLWVRDFKTAQDQFSTFFKKYELTDQQVGYVIGARKAGMPVRGYIMTCMRKLKASKPEEMFQDRKYLVSPQDELQWVARKQAQWRLIQWLRREHKKRGLEAYNQNFERCFLMGECPMWLVCRNPSTQDATLAAYYQVQEYEA